MKRVLFVWLLLTSYVPGGDGKWTTAVVIPAAEANQAAAADGRFYYAIGSTQVAKYDRHTRERVAVSTGEAKHLNSGFFLDGKLYCAHSNYPQKPERSEIFVLDPETMRLAVWKDFGTYDAEHGSGSLTWAVRHDGHWWCNFARYGADNAGTFLVQFNDDWTERSRWTYPPEVIGKLGRHSLSGGLWRDGLLLVTGHDDRVLFRLRLPEAGTVLQRVDEQDVPFAGQGFAADPVTGGLIGIDRKQKQLILTQQVTEPVRLRVLTYNIHHGEGTDRKLDLERIARTILSVQPDFVALQEVDRNVPRSGSVDQPAELARLTKMHSAFGRNIPLNGGEYGNAALSRFSIRDRQNHLLPRKDNGEQRGVLAVDVEVPGIPAPVLFLATHLDHRGDDAERRASATFLNEFAGQVSRRTEAPPAGMLLLGDLNDTPESATLKALRDHWASATAQALPTWPSHKPETQIDHILFRPADAWRVIEVKRLPEAVASDHLGVMTVLEWAGRP